MSRAQRCTTPTAGPGPPPGRWSATDPVGRQFEIGDVAARRQSARGPLRRQRRGVRPRHRDLDRHGEADTTHGHPHAGHAARWQGARGGRRRHVQRPRPGRAVRSGHGHLDRHREDGYASPGTHRGAAARWQGARRERRRQLRLEGHLRGAVRPGHRDLVRHREHAQAPRGLPRHIAGRRQGARGG